MIFSLSINNINSVEGSLQTSDSTPEYTGVNMKGLYTSISQQRGASGSLPTNYYEDSFKLISEAGLNSVRYLIYWEAYESNPQLFVEELKSVANAADKYGVKVIYDNHQFHTSSWLNPDRGTGFPAVLFVNDKELYPFSSGGSPGYNSAKTWWSNWWDRKITDASGNEGWILLLNFLKEIVNQVDKHESTLGYEILSEPQLHNPLQWEKIGSFNSFMIDELRKVTQKSLLFSQQIPASQNNKAIEMTPENMAKMAPVNKTNTIFKVSLYGVPVPDTFQGDRFSIYVNAAKLAGVPIYVGEWNNIEREATVEDGKTVWKINEKNSDINQTTANSFIEYMNKSGVWGWAYWHWNFKPHGTPNFNLISVTPEGTIQPNKYYHILKNASLSYQNID